SDILIGNSASPENNHLDTFKVIRERFDIVGRRIVVPLSYGDMHYREHVVRAGKQLFGDKFQPLLGYMSRAEYFESLSSCGFVVMNHSRQQAIGNVSAALLSGARLFMNPLSPLYDYLNARGFFVDELSEASGDLSPLSIEQRLVNKKLILETWGCDAHQSQLIALAILIQKHLDRAPGRLSVSAASISPEPTPFFSIVM